MSIELSTLEARVIGSLIEKQITTPDQYPLSLNALTAACNQKSNRDPVMQVGEAEVQQALDELRKRHLVTDRSGFGSRVTKWQQRLCNSEFGVLRFSPQETAVVCELLLRGPQTPGELRTRAGRLSRFGDLGEVEATLEGLMTREDGPFVARLPREPGRREVRYVQLLTGEPEAGASTEPLPAAPAAAGDDRLARLEARLEDLVERVEALAGRLERLEG